MSWCVNEWLEIKEGMQEGWKGRFKEAKKGELVSRKKEKVWKSK